MSSRILFVVADLFIGEPIGVLQLSAILKQEGHQTRMIGLRSHSLAGALDVYRPDVIAYSACSPDVGLFHDADRTVREWLAREGRTALRIMGGPHATYFPEVVGEMALDAACRGEGDRAIREIVRRFERGEGLEGIPNVVGPADDPEAIPREVINDLDELPFLDKEIYYEAMPVFRSFGLKSVMTSRGCPYDCTYCHNHAHRKLFAGLGRIVRRRSVDHVIREIKHIVSHYPETSLIKFCDDTFAHRVDDWLLEFLDRYRREIGVPFYCLMRSNTMSDRMAQLLRESGCISLCMAIESGNELVRNKVLKRNISDETVINSFLYTAKYKIKTWGNTILGIPGTTLDDDWESFLFTRNLKITAPTFGVFTPYPKLQLTDYAMEIGVLDKDYDFSHQVGDESALNCYTAREKRMQRSLAYLAPIFCALPDAFLPLLRRLLKVNLLPVYKQIGGVYFILKVALNIFPGIYPLNPFKLMNVFRQCVRFWILKKKVV